MWKIKMFISKNNIKVYLRATAFTSKVKGYFMPTDAFREYQHINTQKSIRHSEWHIPRFRDTIHAEYLLR